MWECIDIVEVGARAKKSLAEFKRLIKQFGKRSQTANAYEVAAYIARQSGIIDVLKADTTIEGMGRLENLNALLDGIKDFVESDEVEEGEVLEVDKSLASYLQNIALLTDLDTDTGDDDFVTLMSVHAAKGLEFKSVFIVGLEEKLFPSFMSLDTREGIDEERRLFYVAITRAEQILTLSYATSRYKFGSMRYNEPSRFLNEISIEHLSSTSSISQPSNRPVTAGVSGNFKTKRKSSVPVNAIDPKDFHPSPSKDIQVGMKVLHLRFGQGKVLSIDGAPGNRVATIFFKGIDNPQRKIMLRFAKLQIQT